MKVPSATSERMKRVKRTGTSPELAVRRFLSALRLRYRLNGRRLAGAPDIVNQSRRWVIFVHGCFWHAHARCRRAMMPRTNRLFWQRKRHRNAQRDRRVVAELERAGYTVLIIWGCHTSQLAYVAASIRQLLAAATLRGRGTVRETSRDRRTNKIVLRVKRGA